MRKLYFICLLFLIFVLINNTYSQSKFSDNILITTDYLLYTISTTAIQVNYSITNKNDFPVYIAKCGGHATYVIKKIVDSIWINNGGSSCLAIFAPSSLKLEKNECYSDYIQFSRSGEYRIAFICPLDTNLSNPDTVLSNSFSIDSLTTDITDIKAKLPTKFYLSNNYPNPFNPTTTINYSIPKTEFVSLKVFDLLGREIALLVSEEKSRGIYRVNFDGSSLPSGIYFYHLKVGYYSEAKKFVLMK